jgi:hypothetical protein
MKLKPITLLILMVTFSGIAFGQGQINLMNGKIIKIDSVVGKVDNEVIYHRPGEKNNETIGFKKIFSINHPNGNEEIYYVYDSINNADMTVPHEKSYILGRQNARENYHAPTATFGGIIIGSASSILGLVYGPVPIAMYSVIASLHYPNVAHQEFSDKAMVDDPYYQYGYQIRAKRQKMKNAFISSAICFGILYAITKKNTSAVEKDIDKFFHNKF